ncbi:MULTISPECIES: 50S ribosomal protein L24 [Nocardiopsis]|jgi:large subunit ribosomal protein L24|uniref:Large ribosomal subunit protein uL24 n=2 Tax=Nocardiopsis TaxID=2013 RepID=D7B8K7_NOCDD|nr:MULTISPECIES: 50S ribosomal protein L24 [Nocardiopsis]PDP86107.1 50S ribosomal protein L24 [Glycomyces fuscus]ADH70515.1 ribosomal protein L24 [Nocardiopsis dassonvillei subsp. dassonvillei DSM 43111]APC33788.1 50S ribosomal protein L24 [Nocardiopsis dassonvillei]ASU56643.1 50S ribosomal protein L24 [Nocardiopsis dassonvillei]MCK9872666.1 50S ribosomal protein L24 [Nocardiopsis dassonvillei]
MKIKSGDEVIVLAGKNRGATGKVVKALPKEDRVVVEGVNLVKKHRKANPAGGQQGEVVTKEAPIHVSNVALVEDGKATRVGYRFEEDGTKVRVSRRTGKDI